MKTRVLVPSGALGLTYDLKALEQGLKKRPDIIAIDGGSTDSGPSYLGQGISKYSRQSTKTEWKILMEARARANIPLLIGTAGTCGTDSAVDWLLDITREIAKDLNQSLKIVTIKCSQPRPKIIEFLKSGKIKALSNAPKISKSKIRGCRNIVALAGVEQIIEALNEKPDIVIAGRTTDTAVIAALPILRGIDAGAAWHGAKIAECGALCTTHPMSGVIIVEFCGDHFIIEPMAKTAKATVNTVSAHMLYENSDPYILYEPGGHLDTSTAIYTALNERKVSVSGSKWYKAPTYNVKLEGAELVGFQTIALVLLRDAKYVKNAEKWTRDIKSKCSKSIKEKLKIDYTDFSLELRIIGKNACFGKLEVKNSEIHEVGVLGIVTAKTQLLANEIAQILNPFLLHHPLTEDEPLPTFAFPFSPAEISRGPLYSFSLNHVLELTNPMEVFSMDIYVNDQSS